MKLMVQTHQFYKKLESVYRYDIFTDPLIKVFYIKNGFIYIYIYKVNWGKVKENLWL